jgi:hypothetical protein
MAARHGSLSCRHNDILHRVEYRTGPIFSVPSPDLLAQVRIH